MIGVFQTCFEHHISHHRQFSSCASKSRKEGRNLHQKFLYFLCKYGNVSQVPESQDRLAGFRIFPQFEANSWGQDKWSGLYLPARIIVWNHHNYHHCKCRLWRIFYFFQLQKFAQTQYWWNVNVFPVSCENMIRCCNSMLDSNQMLHCNSCMFTWSIFTWVVAPDMILENVNKMLQFTSWSIFDSDELEKKCMQLFFSPRSQILWLCNCIIAT